MAGILRTPDYQRLSTLLDEENEFKTDILLGLQNKNKMIYSKYFYDHRGSQLFNQITQHSDYYLTSCEIEILSSCKNRLVEIINDETFNLIELGPGEGLKTRLLIDEFISSSLSFAYIPIDISKTYLNVIIDQFNKDLPNLELTALNADYLTGLKWLNITSKNRNFVLFLGSSIGNFEFSQAKYFLRQVWDTLNHDDYLLIGFDLRKEIATLLNAYNDSSGITREFNFNLLERVNRELDANFNIEQFFHYETYNAYKGRMESYLVSSIDQNVDIDKLNYSFQFKAFEPILSEYSCKYFLKQIEELAYLTGYKIVSHFEDSRHYFTDSLWQVKKHFQRSI